MNSSHKHIKVALHLAVAVSLWIAASSVFADNAAYVGWHRPTEDVLFDVSVDDASRVIQRVQDTGNSRYDRRAIGQTFQLDGPAPTAAVGRATIKLGRDVAFDHAPHSLQVALMKDTNDSGVGDTLVGQIHYFDVSGLTGSRNHYLTFEFGDPVILETEQTYSIEFWFAEANPAYTDHDRVEEGFTAVNLRIYRGDAVATVGTAGFYIENDAREIGADFPFGEQLTNQGVPNRQMNLVLQGPYPPGFDWSGVPELYPGIQHLHLTPSEPRQLNIHVLRVDLSNPDIRLHTTGRHPDWGTPMNAHPQYTHETQRQRTRDYVIDQRATGMNMVAAINASPWRPWTELPDWNLSGTDKTTFPHADITGLAVSEGLLVSPGEGEIPALLYYRDWTVDLAPAPPEMDLSNVLTAVSAFRFALRNGGIWGSDSPTDHRARTSYGLCKDRRYLF